MSQKRWIAYGMLLLVVANACGWSAPSESSGEATDTAGGTASTPEVPEEARIPVSINEGLASLDSYRLTYTSDIFDSVSQVRTETTFVTARDRASDASYNRTETRTTGGDSEDDGLEVEEQYAIGDQLCVVSEGEASMTQVSEMAQVLSELTSQVVVFQPLIENPVLEGEDLVNAIPVRTYTFELRSLGANTDVEATRSDGRYAIAVDGDYLVHYRLDIELRTAPEGDPEAEFSQLVVELSLEDVNQAVEIAFPAECLAAEASGEG
jgi:hypothetical protein